MAGEYESLCARVKELESRLRDREASLLALRNEYRRMERAQQTGEEHPWVSDMIWPVGVFITDAAGNTLYWNEQLCRITGMTLEEAKGTGWANGVHPEDRERAFAAWYENAETGRDSFSTESRFIHRDGTVSWTVVQAQARRDARGAITGYVGTVTDVTELKQAEHRLARLAEAAENAGEGIAIWGSDDRLEYCNRAFAEILHYGTVQDAHGMAWQSLFSANTPGLAPRVLESLDLAGRWQGRILVAASNGRAIPLDITLTRSQPEGGEPRIVGSLRDRTVEERHLRQIRRLGAGAQELLEAERARLSRELHDHLAQLLTAANMNLAWISRRVQSIDPQLHGQLQETQQIIHGMASRVRSLSKSLRPPILDHEGLLAAIESHVAEFQGNSRIQCRVRASCHEEAVSENVAITAYRILQEALTNAARHSYASACTIDVRQDGDELLLTVEDNGRGFEEAAVEAKSTLGLTGMEERAISLGGYVKIDGRPGKGCRVTAHLPLAAGSGGSNS